MFGESHTITSLGKDNTIGGGKLNSILGNSSGSFIGGGTGNCICNTNITAATEGMEVIGGGMNNYILSNRGCNAIVGGCNNFISSSIDGINSYLNFIGGGRDNTIDAEEHNTISGGQNGIIRGNNFANHVIAGGASNSITGSHTGGSAYNYTIGGGAANKIEGSGLSNTISGGCCNIIANSYHSTIAGGFHNTMSSSPSASSIGGGINNFMYSTTSSFIGSGQENKIYSGSFHTIAGGNLNIISANQQDCSGVFIGGGQSNCVSVAGCSVIAGGLLNQNDHAAQGFMGSGCSNCLCYSSFGVLVGGKGNKVRDESAAILGGCANTSSGNFTIIGGGQNNVITNATTKCHSGIFSGFGNTISSTNKSVILGGSTNTIGTTACCTTIGGGFNNSSTSCQTFIGGGYTNAIAGSVSSIIGGNNNTISSAGTRGAILGGEISTLQHNKSFIVGSNITSTAVCTTFMNSAVITGSLTVGGGNQLSTTLGRIDAKNDILAYSTSDKRLKENIVPIGYAIEKIERINGVTFDWKKLTEEEEIYIHGNKGHDVGVIAQEIEAILPEAVTTRDSGYKAVNYEKIIPLLIEAIKDQQRQIDELKRKI